MAKENLQVKGIIFDIDGNKVEGATVSLIHSNGNLSLTSNSVGEYIFGLGDLSSFSIGDAITVTASKESKGTISETTVIESSGNTINLTLEETSNLDYTETDNNQHNLVFALPVSFDGSKITSANPLPVKIVDANGVNTNTQFITARSYNSNNQMEFLGKAVPGTGKGEAKWQILNYTYDGNKPEDILLSGGSDAFDKVWNNRSTYNYS